MNWNKKSLLTLMFLTINLAGCRIEFGSLTFMSNASDTSPTLEITGDSSVTIGLGETYNDSGAQATDTEDGDLTAIIVTTSDVDTSRLGTYHVQYSVTDSDGNYAAATRTVIVQASIASKTNISDYPVSWESKFDIPPQDSNGWSILTPSADSRLIYVSSSTGNDVTAKPYTPDDTEVNSNPFDPGSNILPFATIEAAMQQMRAGYPDYILLQRGDSWITDSVINMISGRSVAERAVLSYYGSATQRPWVKARSSAVELSDANYSAVVGIHFSATERNPSSPNFVGLENIGNPKGFHVLGGYGNEVVGDVLIEDCWFEWFANNTIQTGAEPLANIVLRRNIVSNDYSTVAHSQGIFSNNASILLEENVFDHNGWYRQAFDQSTQADAVATKFNHNTYFSGSRDTILRKNIFLRSSSINNKFAANAVDTNDIKAWNILVDNNLYIDGEIGISLGGNKDFNDGPRWQNIYVTNNVMMHIGRSQPTNRTLGWGLEINDWDTGLVKGNIFTSWGDSIVNNTYAINTVGDTSHTEFSDNIVYKVLGGTLLLFKDGMSNSDTSFFHNEITTSASNRIMLYALAETGGFHDNQYHSEADQSAWFALDGVRTASLNDYRNASGDTSSIAAVPDYVDPERTVETYLDSLAYDNNMDSFATQLTQQSKFNWNGELTAKAINHYIRQGFCFTGNESCR